MAHKLVRDGVFADSGVMCVCFTFVDGHLKDLVVIYLFCFVMFLCVFRAAIVLIISQSYISICTFF